MYIYKITNKINNKVYIGQTIHSIESRWKRHQYDAFKKDTHFARAIRKYGAENFIVEQIDIANSKEELNEKEIYWIKYYNSTIDGYNSTDGGEDTNTYKYRTEEEMNITKEKIRQTKLGGKNPMSIKVKCRNEQTKEEYHFNSLSEMQSFLNFNNHSFITKRCNGEIKSLWKGKWNIAYENNDYFDLTKHKNNHRSKKVKVIKQSTKESKEFPSMAEAERYFNKPNKFFSSKAYRHKDKGRFIKDDFEIIFLND